MIDLHHALDLFVMCSDNEGSPNAVLEAMAMRTPVIATEVGGIPDLVDSGTTGLLVPRRGQDALARAIVSLAADPALREAMAGAARSKVERELSFERRMKRVEGVYDELMAMYPEVRQGIKWRQAKAGGAR